MKKLIIVALLGMVFGCTSKNQTIRRESGKVIAKSYTPEIDASGTGISSRGDAVFSHIHEDEKFSVVFRCEHGDLFTVNSLSVYEKLSEGDMVTIDFYEIMGWGGKVVDYDFIDANKR